MAKRKLELNQINLVAENIEASADFYRRLGADVPSAASGEMRSPFHLSCGVANDFDFDLDSPRFAAIWNKSWAGRTDLAGRIVLGFGVETRGDVDAVYSEMTAAGYRGLQPPFDAFWGARYAILEDPNGAAVGVMSPVDTEKRFWPPPGWEE
jgi:catechol 2,3-dioxygenase-like lactoylglutathione lyase family enzyme